MSSPAENASREPSSLHIKTGTPIDLRDDAAAVSSPTDTLTKNVASLMLDTGTSSKTQTKSTTVKKSSPVADSWEDAAADSSSSDTETETPVPTKTAIKRSHAPSSPTAPPPTPASPSSHSSFALPYEHLSSHDSKWGENTNKPERRPDKTTSAAARMIYAGIGVRGPKKTEDQKAEEAAMRKKVKDEREEKVRKAAEKEKAKKAMWDD